LEHLPVSSTTAYKKGQVIFSPTSVSNSIYLVITGKVELSQIAENGDDVLLDIVRPDELFGESSFLGTPCASERATAIENTGVMAWATSDIETLVVRRPRLALALLQILAQRNHERNQRIESLALDTIERRLARTLIRFAERLGVSEGNGSIRMRPFTHESLSRYVGTSREIITQYMNRFRKQGFLEYSRRGIVLHGDMLKTRLAENTVRSFSTSS
jgi:CRP-like cAMP-binding protein